MAKLTVSLEQAFVTNGFLFNDEETSEERLMTAAEAKKYFESIDREKLALYVVSFNPDDECDAVGFEFPTSSVKKGGIFESDLLPDCSGMSVRISGQLEVTLRAGAKNYVTSARPLLVQGLSYRGGSYMGFMSYLNGQTEDNVTSWFQIQTYSVK